MDPLLKLSFKKSIFKVPLAQNYEPNVEEATMKILRKLFENLNVMHYKISYKLKFFENNQQI